MSLRLTRRGLKGLCGSVMRESYCRISTFVPLRHHAKDVANFGNFLSIACRKFSATAVDHTTPAANQPQNEDGDTSSKDLSLVLGPSEQLMTSLSPEDQKKLKVLTMEIELYRQSGNPVPQQMTDRMWLDALTEDNQEERRKFYRFLLIKENYVLYRKNRKAEQAKRRELHFNAPRKVVAEGVIDYGLGRNTIFQVLRPSSINDHFNHWQCHGILFGQNIVVDLDYDDCMSEIENNMCANQIKKMYSANKVNRDPFHLHFCNARPGNRTYEVVQSYMPNLNTHSNLISVHGECYSDIFPREKLVFLTPHCHEALTCYDHDAVYIVGGVVGKSLNQSLNKAKKQGIAMARLSLDTNIELGKTLTLDQRMKIMLNIKNTGCWKTSLAHVSKQKLKRDDDDNLPEKSKPAKIRRRLSILYDKDE